jgi:DNA modification methylase
VIRWTRLRGDAFSLPLRDASVDVVVADPPYEGTKKNKANRGKRGVHAAKVGYVLFLGRAWVHEALRVLKPSGHLYLVVPVRELAAWLEDFGQPEDILSWFAPNAPSMSAFWRRGIGGRAPSWRPILHYQKPPREAIRWPGGFVQPNVITASMIQGGMREALPWPNQLPEQLVRHILTPHSGLVLDLFAGTGTCGQIAASLGLACVSVDMSEQALAITKRRGVTPPMWAAMEAT